jgi:hypothetical protein
VKEEVCGLVAPLPFFNWGEFEGFAEFANR